MPSELSNFISEIGFPIFAFCAMFYMCNTTIKENTAAITKLNRVIKNVEIKESINDDGTDTI